MPIKSVKMKISNIKTTEGTLSGFQDIFLQPIIKDRPNKNTEAYDGKWYKEAVIITRNTKYVATRSGNNRM